MVIILYIGDNMKTIKLSDYKKEMGTLINVEDEYTYLKDHHKYSINIPYNKLIYNYQTLLNKNEPYFIMCNGGYKSKKITNTLSFYGYDVTNVIK